MMSFLDYNQILMLLEDQEKTSCITARGIYYHIAMLFGIKNVGSTYQRLTNEMFVNVIEQTMEVYINDMIVKSKRSADHTAHVQETFFILHRYNMKLNPAKCLFGVTSGKFIGYLLTKRGIKADRSQIKVVESYSPLKM